MLKVLLGIELVLIALGVALIPLPGPGFIVLTLGVIVTAVAAALLQHRPKRT
ncbi:PGPGW domain-containing protein [Knoellia sp. CPCC 206435]|uniref:PGPGW domain-containing protein n=1 Tax=Knoellia terrae TaxID=3404797 RepID=UPI003B42B18E